MKTCSKLAALVTFVSLSLAHAGASAHRNGSHSSDCPSCYGSSSNAMPTTQYSSGAQTVVRAAVPPAVYCRDTDSPVMTLDVAYTLWTAREESLAVAVSNWYLVPVAAAAASQGSVHYPSWKLCSGFKIGAGWFSEHDCWDVKFLYTWFSNKHNGMKEASFTAGQALPTWVNDGFILDSASSSWSNWFQRLDAQVGRDFYVGQYIALRPFAGLLGAWDKQWFDIDYVRAASIASSWENMQKWWGIGPYGGFNTNFIFCNSNDTEWSFFLNSGFALTWSHFQTSQQYLNADGLYLANYGNNFWQVSPMLEVSLGLRYETDFACWCPNSFLTLEAAWEEQVWFSHNQFMIVSESQSLSGNYAMQGFTLKAGLAF
ncbi:MAG: hypothetical protein JSR76_05800 [Verrucomicrobia bacterium]|nr:hypothetical protein [Verrucomicrobiota bacterium]